MGYKYYSVSTCEKKKKKKKEKKKKKKKSAGDLGYYNVGIEWGVGVGGRGSIPDSWMLVVRLRSR